MKNITHFFNDVYIPAKALLIYNPLKGEHEKEVYIESYDLDEHGNPFNAHPLSGKEYAELSEAFDNTNEMKRGFLKPKGLLPENILYIDPSQNGFAIWHTPAKQVNLFFVKELGIPNGKAKIPPLIWKASKNSLSIYAVNGNKKPVEKTALYYAPFFNIYKDGRVCMGTVEIDISKKTFLEEFVKGWEDYFFNSYFSHLIDDHNPVTQNIVQLWENQIKMNMSFPDDCLIKNGLTIKNLFL